MKKWIALLLVSVMVGSVAACSSTPAQGQQGSTSEGLQQATPEEKAEEKEVAWNKTVEFYMKKAEDVTVTDTHVNFTDDSGREPLSIEKNPKKVAVLFNSLACLWNEAGGTVQLAVGGKSAVKTYKEQIGRDITQDEGTIVVTESPSGAEWDIEKILVEKPDLIICSVGMKGYETISGPAQAANIPVIAIDYDGVQDYLKWFKVFCNLSGHPELWDEVAQAAANRIVEIVSSVPKEEKAPTAAILVVISDTLKAYTISSQAGIILKELGGVNVVDPNSEGTTASVEISLEDLYALDPDMLFVSERGEPGAMMAQLQEMVGDNPVWKELRAVKEEKVYVLEKGLFHNKANKRYSESYEAMARYLYPEAAF